MLLSEKKRGRGRPKKDANKYKEARLHFRFPWSCVADVDVYAQSIGRTRADVIRWAVREYLDRNAKRQPDED